MQEVTARRFFTLVDRLPAYQGVMAARVAAEQHEQQEQQQDVSVAEVNALMPGTIEVARVEV